MRERWRRYRVGILLGGGFLLVVVLTALLAGGGGRGTLDPDGYDPGGAHALAALLRDRGVTVTRTTDVPSTLAAAGGGTTVFVPLPALLSPQELHALAQAPGELVVAGAGPEALRALDSRVRAVGQDEPTVLSPGCADEVVTNAGRALAGGIGYRADGCYPAAGGRSLVREGHLVLLGSAEALTNEHLDEEGDAALGIGLLGRRSAVAWLVPSPSRAAFGERPVTSPDQLLPHWLHLVRWQLVVAALLLVLWRARRLGRVVTEQLPVVVRACETVEGHGRMYQVSGARDSAAEALRESARRRLGRLSHGGTVDGEGLVPLVAARAGRDAGAVRSLLYGPTPADDADLVRLATGLDALVHDALDREAAGP